MSSPPVTRSAARIAAIYLLVGVGWIVVSDLAVSTFTHGGHADPALLANVAKGTLFVVVTAVLLFVLIRRELAGREEAEERQRAEARVFEEMIRASPVPILTLDAQGAVRIWNPAAADTFGWTAEEVVGRPLPWLEEDRNGGELQRALLPRTQEGSPPESLEVHRRRKDGVILALRVTTAPLPPREDLPPELLAIIQDVTPRQEEERRRRLLAEVLEATSDLVEVVTPAGEVIYRNRAARDLLGGPERDGGSGPSMWGHRPAGWRTIWEEEVLPIVARGQVWQGEGVFLDWEQSEHQLSQVILGHQDPEGGLLLLSTVARDLTRERELEAQLRQAQKLELMGQLAGGIAHDFNNLLTVIRSNTELVARELTNGEIPGAVPALLEDLLGAADRGADLVKGLLLFSRREDLLPRLVDPGAVVADAALTLQRLLPSSIQVRLDTQEDLPPILADPGVVQQLLLNLATNARDAMEGPGRLTIGVETVSAGEDQGERVEIRVEDTGAGIPAHFLSRVFEPFFTTKPPGRGTGLGLPMVRALMAEHGGTVELESREGEGTSVRLFFPAARRGSLEPHSTDPPDPEFPRGSETILVVEDEPAIRRALRHTLSRLGYTVVEADNGEDGVQIAGERPEVALVISDLIMPRMGGEGMRRRLRESGSRVPFLFVSGYDARELPGPLADPDLFLPKPWSIRDLAVAVRRTLDRHREVPGGEPAG